MTNGNPDAVLLVTQNWWHRPDGTGGAWNNARIGVWYNNSISKWAIFNQYDYPDEPIPAMPTGASFNVMVLENCRSGCVPCTCEDIDFSGDGIVNFIDFASMAQSWQRNDPAVDLAPSVFIVNIGDLLVFAEYWLEKCQ